MKIVLYSYNFQTDSKLQFNNCNNFFYTLPVTTLYITTCTIKIKNNIKYYSKKE